MLLFVIDAVIVTGCDRLEAQRTHLQSGVAMPHSEASSGLSEPSSPRATSLQGRSSGPYGFSSLASRGWCCRRGEAELGAVEPHSVASRVAGGDIEVLLDLAPRLLQAAVSHVPQVLRNALC